MSVEIERKFLVRHDGWKTAADAGQRLSQGYIVQDGQGSVRVRLTGDMAWLTVKGTSTGLSRPEFEYEIPVAQARDMLQTFCPTALLSKTRYRVPHEGMIWEVDVFEGAAHGLVLAEVELSHADQLVAIPAWAGREVTHDPRYRNSSIIRAVPENIDENMAI